MAIAAAAVKTSGEADAKAVARGELHRASGAVDPEAVRQVMLELPSLNLDAGVLVRTFERGVPFRPKWQERAFSDLKPRVTTNFFSWICSSSRRV